MKTAPSRSLLAVCLVAGTPALAFAQQAKPAPAAPAHTTAAPARGATAVATPAAATSAPRTVPAGKAAAGAVPATADAGHPAGAAVAGAAASAPKPATELDQMKVLEGSWRCDGRAPAGPGGPERAYKSTWKFKRDLDNFWWAAEYTQVKAKTNPTPMKARGYMTYDPATRDFVMVGMDNMGGTSNESTTGWSGDSVTLAGDASQGGRKVPYREVITKNGPREFTWRGEMKVGGDWVTLGEDRCRK